MRRAFLVCASVAVVAVLSGCKGGGKTLPENMTGTYTHPARFPDGERELTVTKTGLAATGQFGQGSLNMNPLGGRVAMGTATSDLFVKTSCDGDTCTFKTKEGCEGSVTRTTAGDVDVVVNGACSGWAGHWTKR